MVCTASKDEFSSVSGFICNQTLELTKLLVSSLNVNFYMMIKKISLFQAYQENIQAVTIYSDFNSTECENYKTAKS